MLLNDKINLNKSITKLHIYILLSILTMYINTYTYILKIKD